MAPEAREMHYLAGEPYDPAYYGHIPRPLMESLRLYVDRGVSTGGFLRAVLENDLMQSIGRASEDSLDCLPKLCQLIYHCLPSNAHGDRERVARWIGRGGMMGETHTARERGEELSL